MKVPIQITVNQTVLNCEVEVYESDDGREIVFFDDEAGLQIVCTNNAAEELARSVLDIRRAALKARMEGLDG